MEPMKLVLGVLAVVVVELVATEILNVHQKFQIIRNTWAPSVTINHHNHNQSPQQANQHQVQVLLQLEDTIQKVQEKIM